MGFAGILFFSVPTQPVQFKPRKRITFDSGNGNVLSFREEEKENSGMNRHIFLKKNATLNVDLLTTKLSKKSIL